MEPAKAVGALLLVRRCHQDLSHCWFLGKRLTECSYLTESSAFAPPNSCLSAALPKLDQAAGSCGERSNRLHAHPGEDLRELTPKPRSKEKHDNLTCCFLGISWLSTLCCFIGWLNLGWASAPPPLQILILSYSNLTRWCVVTPGNTWESFTASPPCKAISTNWPAGGRFFCRLVDLNLTSRWLWQHLPARVDTYVCGQTLWSDHVQATRQCAHHGQLMQLESRLRAWPNQTWPWSLGRWGEFGADLRSKQLRSSKKNAVLLTVLPKWSIHELRLPVAANYSAHICTHTHTLTVQTAQQQDVTRLSSSVSCTCWQGQHSPAFGLVHQKKQSKQQRVLIFLQQWVWLFWCWYHQLKRSQFHRRAPSIS